MGRTGLLQLYGWGACVELLSGLPVGSGWVPGGFRLGSGWVGSGWFRLGFGWVPAGFRVGSCWVASAWVPAGFLVPFVWLLSWLDPTVFLLGSASFSYSPLHAHAYVLALVTPTLPETY